MATTKSGANGTSKTAAEMKEWFENNRSSVENYERANNSIVLLRDITQAIDTKRVQTIDKEELKNLIKNIGSSEKKLRVTARYLFYRSNIFYRIVMWYASMWDLRCRKVVPKYSITGTNNPKQMKLSFDKTLEKLDVLNNQGNVIEGLINCYVQDVYYAIRYTDKTGTFYYALDPDECIIDSRYSTGDFGFAIDASKWASKKRRQLAEYLGSPMTDIIAEFDRTHQKYIHMPDKYAFCLKFRSDTWDVIAPPLLPTFLQLAGLEDLVDIQADADALSVYKLIYMPMKVLSGTKQSDDFEITPDISLKYLDRMISGGAVPEGVAVAAVPGDELKVIDFSKTVDSDTNSVETAAKQILQTAGGGAVINANNITSTAAFNAWLKAETEFAMSTLMPQINGYTNRILGYEVGNNACKVEHFEVSVYTKQDLAEQLLTSCQYSFANRLAYNTLLGISEKDTLAMLYFENDVLGLPNIMKYPLQSSYTQNGDTESDTDPVTGGRPKSDDSDLTSSGDRARNS